MISLSRSRGLVATGRTTIETEIGEGRRKDKMNQGRRPEGQSGLERSDQSSDQPRFWFGASQSSSNVMPPLTHVPMIFW